MDQADNLLFYSPALEKEYQRWRKQIGADDPYAGKKTIGIHEVLRAHFLILDFFFQEKAGEGVGGVGPKSIDLLHSAVHRQFVSGGGKDKWPTPFEKCATLLYGLVKNHPFHDANKRTAFLTTLLFLDRENRIPKIRQKEFEDFVVDVADNKLEQKYPRYREMKKTNPDYEVQFIADYLRRNTRDVDRKTYTVTFHELRQILRRYRCDLTSPKGNYIDVVRVGEKHKYLGFLGPKVRTETRLVQIGFPGWKKQVNKEALRSVREACGLTPNHGYDSRTFYHDADPMHALIDTYAEPLRRLADR